MGVRDVFEKNLRLEVYDPVDDVYCKSVILEVNAQYLAVTIPMGRKQQPLHMEKDTTWDFRFISKDVPYYFRSSCLGLGTSGQASSYLIGLPGELKKVQRRDYYRFPCAFDLHYWALGGQRENEDVRPLRRVVADISLEERAGQLGEPAKAITANLSGGGLQLVAPARLPVDSVLLLAVFLRSRNKTKTLFLKGKVVWADENELQRTLNYRHAVKFIDLDERVRDEIVGFIFLLMRERMI